MVMGDDKEYQRSANSSIATRPFYQQTHQNKSSSIESRVGKNQNSPYKMDFKRIYRTPPVEFSLRTQTFVFDAKYNFEEMKRAGIKPIFRNSLKSFSTDIHHC